MSAPAPVEGIHAMTAWKDASRRQLLQGKHACTALITQLTAVVPLSQRMHASYMQLHSTAAHGMPTVMHLEWRCLKLAAVPQPTRGQPEYLFAFFKLH